VAEAFQVDDGSAVPFTAAAAYEAGQVVQLNDGRAGVVAAAVAVGGVGSAYVRGRFGLVKAAGVVILDGGRAYWDYSANAGHFRKVNDRDFYLGRAVGDASSTATLMAVALNIDPPYDLDLARDPYVTAPTGTQALGGFLPPQRVGGGHKLLLSATNEAQKADALGKDGFVIAAGCVVELAFAVVNGGAGAAADFNVGLASVTHATDADLIAEHLFVHLDAASTAIKVQSKDPVTTVAATDTTTTYAAGATNRKEVWFDLRNPADVQVYVDGVNVLPASVFRLDNSAATLKLLAHLEKTVSTDTFEVDVEWLRARFAE
jgi:predicted RecA/RadA family phage recombinase